MKYLLVIAHADPRGESHAHILAKAAQESLAAHGNEVRIVDLLKEGFGVCANIDDFVDKGGSGKLSYNGSQANRDNLIPAIREQQENLLWCDYLLVFGPIWFYRLPAIFNAWIERVFTAGWAYDFTKPVTEYPLYGKKAMFVVTAGASDQFYSHGTGLTSTEGMMYLNTYVLSGCGFTVYRTASFYGCPRTINFDEALSKWKEAVLKIDKRPVLPFNKKVEGVDEIQQFAEIPNFTLDEALAA